MKHSSTLEVLEQINKPIILTDEYATARIKENHNSITIEICCKQDSDINYIVATNYEQEAVPEFISCAKMFDGKNILSFRDDFLDTELEIGFEISKNICLFFEIFDYKYDTDQRKKISTFKIYDQSEDYQILKSFIDFIRNQENKKELGENYESRNNTIKYERTSRL